MHQPVLLKEIMTLLDLKSGDAVIDGTAGGGGHAKEILKRVGNSGKLMLIDWDAATAGKLEKEMENFSNVKVIIGNYADLPEIMTKNNFPKADGLLLDLGFSSDQLAGGRGFSFNPPPGGEPLLMTYSKEIESLGEFLKRATAEELTEIIHQYGEERHARRIAEGIYKNKNLIRNTEDLVKIIKNSVPKFYERGRIHPATRTFQAFRIYLNKELENLEKALRALPEILKTGGRAAIISFHSLEDRIVKKYFNDFKKQGRLKILTKKPIRASAEEIAQNSRARSAKLRAAILI